MISKILLYSSYCLFLISGAMCYAFVFDVEPISTEKEYALERDIFDRTSNHYEDFPTYNDWLADREESQVRFHAWVVGLGAQLGYEAATCFDPWLDTTQSQPAAAPENWAKGERD